LPAESVFKKRTLRDIYEEIRTIYLSDDRPWILGFSGGKDSTCMVQLIWNSLLELPIEKRHKKIYVISSDTLVESPKIVEQITTTLENMEKTAKENNLSISTNLVRPILDDTFWVNLLGRGYPAPSNFFRWCTDRLKINNADRFITEKVSEYGEAIVVLGSRKDESGSRQQLMNSYEIKGSLLNRHPKYPQTYYYSPIKDFTTEDVWNYLLQNKNPWGNNNRDLLALYQNANASECPLVVDTSTPSCGNSRFGCWVCTVVSKDSSMESLIDSGEDWMQPLLDLREELKKTHEPEIKEKVRELKRRSGHMKLYDDGSERFVPGPYKMEFCKKILGELLDAQIKVRKNGPDPNINLISEEELHEIQRIWRMERGDWKNSVYEIYEKVTGEKLQTVREDFGSFGKIEQELLEQVCNQHNVPRILVSKLLNTEFELMGMTKHSKIYDKIKRIFSEEWREDINEIRQDLAQRRLEKEKFG